MKDKVREVYNQLALHYANETAESSLYNSEYERPAMIAQLPEGLNDLAVLDAGCAAGWYTEQFLKAGAHVTALDLSPEMVKAAKKRTEGQAKVLCADLASDLPFEDQSFDWIVSSLTLHYLKDWNKTFREFKRILKPGGQLLFSVHHPMTDIELLSETEYFQTELITEHWKKAGQFYEVLFFRRPLNDVINDTLKYFSIEKLIEPQPTMEFKKLSSDGYQRLMKRPQFLIIKASR